jgi:hypothetical protein
MSLLLSVTVTHILLLLSVAITHVITSVCNIDTLCHYLMTYVTHWQKKCVTFTDRNNDMSLLLIEVMACVTATDRSNDIYVTIIDSNNDNLSLLLTEVMEWHMSLLLSVTVTHILLFLSVRDTYVITSVSNSNTCHYFCQ